MKICLLCLIRAYQLLVSPMLPGQCRFLPSCSDYARQALEEHGAVRGSVLTVRRLLRCQPLCKGGFDPVPKRLSRPLGEERDASGL